MIKDNEFLQEAADSIYKANADEIVCQQCRAREEAERRERTLERNIKILQDDLENTKEERDKFKAEYENMKVELERLKKSTMRINLFPVSGNYDTRCGIFV